jgi:hypothetical protein
MLAASLAAGGCSFVVDTTGLYGGSEPALDASAPDETGADASHDSRDSGGPTSDGAPSDGAVFDAGTCKATRSSCMGDGECCSGTCVFKMCVCLSAPSTCKPTNPAACCSGVCIGNACQ